MNEMNSRTEEWSTTDSNLRNRVSNDEDDRGANTSIDADDLDNENGNSIPKKRGNGRTYVKIKEFFDYDTANEFMEKNDDYTFRVVRPSHYDGDKDWYTCANNNQKLFTY